jgi:hypothetical protein
MEPWAAALLGVGCFFFYGVAATVTGVVSYHLGMQAYRKKKAAYDNSERSVFNYGPSEPDGFDYIFMGVLWPFGMWYLLGVLIINRMEANTERSSLSKEQQAIMAAVLKELEGL